MISCPICGGKMINVEKGVLTFNEHTIRDLNYSKCENCGEVFFSAKQCQEYEEKINKLK